MAYKGKKLGELKGSALQRRIAQLVANPGTRSAIPTKYLTGANAKYAAARLTEQRLNAPVVSGSEMTNRDLAREANAATAVQYRPQERALSEQFAQNELQRRNTGDYYDQYLKTLADANVKAQQNAAHIAENIQGIGQSGQQAATNADTSTLQRMQADAQRRGAKVDPGLAVQASQGAQVNRNLSDAQAGTASLLGQSAQNFLSALQAAGGQQKGQALGRNALEASELGKRRTDLRGEEGQSNLAYRSKRRSEEFSNVATAALTGQKAESADAQFSSQTGYTPAQWAQLTPSEKLNALKKATKAKTKPAAKPKPRSQEEIDRPYLTKYGKTYEEFKRLSAQGKPPKPLSSAKPGKKPGKEARPSTGAGSLSPAEESKRASHVTKAAQLLHDVKIPYKDANGNPTLRKAKNRGEVIAWLKAQGIDPDLLGVANSLAANNLKGIGKRGVEHAHRAGLHVGGRYTVIK